jgi:hypothetical protein
MDHEHFDTLARRVFSDLKHSRRVAVTTLLASALLGSRSSAGLAAARRKAKAKATPQGADACYPGGTTCIPGKGRNTSGCDFAFSTLFRNRDVRGANLSHSSFAGADLRGADFRGANLSGGCFASANLTGARLGSSVNLGGAIFCNTIMPDGQRDDSGCEGATPCCHLRVQNCPDSTIDCYTVDDDGCRQLFVDTLGTFGNCWSFLGGCCPCDHPDYGYWESQCNLLFPQGCRQCRECTGQCLALQGDIFPTCNVFPRC